MKPTYICIHFRTEFPKWQHFGPTGVCERALNSQFSSITLQKTLLLRLPSVHNKMKEGKGPQSPRG